MKSEYEVLEVLDPKEIARAYRRQLGVDVSRLLPKRLEFRKDFKSRLLYFHPPCCGDTQFYSDLQAFDWYYKENKPEYQYAVQYTAGKRVLDVGSGSGKFATVSLASEYIGLEFNERAIKEGLKKGLQIKQEDIQTFSHSNSQSFDVVCMFQVLEHVAEPLAMLTAARDILAENGLLIVSVPSEDGFVGKARNNILNMPPHHVTRWTDEALINLANELEMKLIQLWHEPLDQVHEGWFASVKGAEMISNLLGRKQWPLLSNALGDRLISFLGRVLGRILRPQLVNNPAEHFGHTVTLVLERNR